MIQIFFSTTDIYIWTPRSITLPRSRCACGVISMELDPLLLSPCHEDSLSVVAKTMIMEVEILCLQYDLLIFNVLDWYTSVLCPKNVHLAR